MSEWYKHHPPVPSVTGLLKLNVTYVSPILFIKYQKWDYGWSWSLIIHIGSLNSSFKHFQKPDQWNSGCVAIMITS